MALIKCSECGKDVSDRAKICPNCGCPVEKFPDEKRFPLLTLAALSLLMLFAVSMMFLRLGWITNSVLLTATFVVSILALRSGEKGALWASIPLFVSTITVFGIIISGMLRGN